MKKNILLLAVLGMFLAGIAVGCSQDTVGEATPAKAAEGTDRKTGLDPQ